MLKRLMIRVYLMLCITILFIIYKYVRNHSALLILRCSPLFYAFQSVVSFRWFRLSVCCFLSAVSYTCYVASSFLLRKTIVRSGKCIIATAWFYLYKHSMLHWTCSTDTLWKQIPSLYIDLVLMTHS